MTAPAAGEIADRFWRATFEGMVELIRDAEATEAEPPPMVKQYPGARRCPLPTDVPARLGMATSAFAATVPQRRDAMTVAGLSTLLRYTHGFSRQQMSGRGWPYHRVVASARCLHPTQVYLWWPGTDDLAGGLHYYDAAHHTLVEVRAGDLRAGLEAALGLPLRNASCALLLTCRFARTAYHYGSYAYRLGTQEAGMVAGNAHLVAARLGLRARLHYQFLDQAVNDLLGLADDREATLCVVTLDGAAARPAVVTGPTTTGAATGGDPRDTLDPVRCRLLLEHHRASQLSGMCSHLPGGLALSPPAPAGLGLPVPPPPVLATLPDLADLLRQRSSGSFWYTPDGSQIGAEVLWWVARYALGPYHTDVTADGCQPPLDCYLVVNDVSGIPAGRYRVRHSDGALEPLRGGAVTMDRATSAAFGLVPSVTKKCGLIVFLVGDRELAASQFGPRGFRILGQESGVIAHRVTLLAAAGGHTGRVFNQYRADKVSELLGLAGTSAVPLFQVLVGHDRMRTSYELPVWG